MAGPASAFSGSYCAGTVLAETTLTIRMPAPISPPILVPFADENPTPQFWQIGLHFTQSVTSVLETDLSMVATMAEFRLELPGSFGRICRQSLEAQEARRGGTRPP